VTVNVQIANWSLNVIKSGQGTVVGTSDPVQPNINCGSVCQASFSDGSVVSLTATPNIHRVFTGWGGACTGVGTCMVTIDDAKTVYAYFAVDPNYKEF